MKLSIFASAIRPHLWEDLLKSLRGGKYEYEVIFAGYIDQLLVSEMFKDYPEFKYITTGEIKPSSCYEISRRACKGKLIHWTADDAIYSEGFVDKVCDYYESIYSVNPIIISCKTNENNNNETMLNHRFFSRNQNTPIMAPLGIMTKEYSDYLGGLDSRYVAGQWENDLVMRAYADGAKCYIYEDVCISLDHANKHKANDDFKGGYNEDRETLENSWVIGGYREHEKPLFINPLKHGQKPYFYHPIINHEVTLVRNDKFSPYPNEISLTESLPPKGQWR
jgi:hypothetical protein